MSTRPEDLISRGEDEEGILERAFSGMTGGLREREKLAATENEFLRKAIGDAGFKITEVREAAKLAGYKLEKLPELPKP